MAASQEAVFAPSVRSMSQSDTATPMSDDTRNTLFQPWADDVVFRWFLYGFGARIVALPLLVFCVYWLLPFLLCAYEGVLLSQSGGEQLIKLLTTYDVPAYLIELTRQFMQHQLILGANGTGYLEDTTHLLFTIILCFGTTVGSLTFRGFNQTAALLLKDHIPRTSAERVASIYNRFKRSAFQVRYILLAAFCGASACLLFVYLWQTPKTAYWWGNAKHGSAGLVFAVIIGGMVYSLVWTAILLVYGSLMLSRLVRLPIELQPFHRDGCNGFAPLGRQIILLWSNALFAGLAILVTLKFGYLGIERTPIVWVLAVFGSLAIPAMAIVPLLESLKALKRAQHRNLERLGIWLNRNLSDVDVAIQRGQYAEANSLLTALDKMKGLFELYKATNIWPFNPKALAFILSVNIVQVMLTAKQLSSLIPA
jgi:hypothetical protein